MKQILIFMIWVSTFNISYSIASQYEKLISYKAAVQEFEKTGDQDKFENYKSLLTQYYVSGTYEEHVREVCIAAKKHFESIKAMNDSLIVFDVDDTALYHFHTHNEFNFIWQHMPALAYNRPLGKAPAITPVVDLYKFLMQRGFKIVFLTCRTDADYDGTIIELINGGFTFFEQLICIPRATFLSNPSLCGKWKHSIREQLAQKYTIVGCVGDNDRDFVGGLTGHIVKLPNVLQRIYHSNKRSIV